MLNVESRRAAGPPIVAALPVVAVTLGLAGACWAATAWLMNGMDMGVATQPGAFGFFTAAWATMMAAMMLPGAAPAFARHARRSGTMRAAVPFAASYLAIWTLAGVVAYALDRPHGTLAAGAVAIAAAAYELPPVKRHFRRRCHQDAGSGLEYGLCCAGSTAGLMAMLVALDVMSLLWMAVIAVLACAQKLLPAKAAIDVPVALAIAGLGTVIVMAPSAVPGLRPPMM
jgi:predicted metal-binding membrane protein